MKNIPRKYKNNVTNKLTYYVEPSDHTLCTVPCSTIKV